MSILSLGSSKRTKGNRIFLDIIAFLSIISFITGLLGLLGVQAKFLYYVPFQSIASIVLFISVIGFQFKLKKGLWIFLSVLFVMGLILSFTGNAINFQSPDYSDVENLSSENIEQYHEEKTSQGIEERGALYYIGQALFYIGFLSLIIFYFKYYRKYLTGDISLKNISGREDISEEEMQRRIEEKEKKENKIGWMIVIILALAAIGFMIYFGSG